MVGDIVEGFGPSGQSLRGDQRHCSGEQMAVLPITTLERQTGQTSPEWLAASRVCRREEEKDMATYKTSIEIVEDFLAQKRIAIAGVSRDPKSFSANLCEELSRRGYDVVPVNPNLPEILSKKCFARIQDVQPPVDGVLITTAPAATKTIVRDCAEAGVQRVWMYSAGVAGSVSEEAVEFCEAHNIRVVKGECPYMFLPGASGIHWFHGVVLKITGSFPRHASSRS